MKFLSVEDIELIHMQIIDASGGSHGVRDRGRIISVVAAQTQEVFGEELYKSIFEKGAALMRGIIADHAFADGNKRTGVMTALVFINQNGFETEKLNDQEFEDFAVKVAVEHLDIAAIAAWLELHSTKQT